MPTRPPNWGRVLCTLWLARGNLATKENNDMTTKDLIKIIRKIERDNKTENLEIGELRLKNGSSGRSVLGC